MPGEPRSVPSRPSLRYLKLEAKRRLAAGEFPALHDAQAAIAREHGLPSWTALRQAICGPPDRDSHALAQLRWVIGRFDGAGEPAWTAPGEDELRQHFDDGFLAVTPPAALIATIASVAAELREDLVVVRQAPLEAVVRLASLEVRVAVAASPPHRLTQLQGYPRGRPVADPRLAVPPPGLGEAPEEMAAIADETLAGLGLAALALAGGGAGTLPWVITRGWADLNRGVALAAGHRFPATGITVLVTATVVLRLVADGRLGLDDAANDHLRTVRLADDTITVRELLSHTAGVDNPGPAQLMADSVPELAALTGPVIGCSDGARGVVRPSNGGYAALGQLITDVTGQPYADAASRLVLSPLGMTSSSFPVRSAELGPEAVTGYDVTPEGTLSPAPAMICTIPAVAGLWAPAPDIVRLGTGWSALLPAGLAREALTPQTAPAPEGFRVGLGWLISARGDAAVHSGAAPGGSGALLVRIRDGQVHVTLTSRMITLDRIHRRVLRSWASPRAGLGSPQQEGAGR